MYLNKQGTLIKYSIHEISEQKDSVHYTNFVD